MNLDHPVLDQVVLSSSTLFDAKRYPWFGDEFIHPNELIGTAPPELIAPAPTINGKPPLRAKTG